MGVRSAQKRRTRERKERQQRALGNLNKALRRAGQSGVKNFHVLSELSKQQIVEHYGT